MGVSLVESSSDEKHDVVNHVCIAVTSQSLSTTSQANDVRDVFKELAQRLYSITPEVVELVDKNLGSLVCNGSSRNREWFVSKEIAIICRRQLGPEVLWEML